MVRVPYQGKNQSEAWTDSPAPRQFRNQLRAEEERGESTPAAEVRGLTLGADGRLRRRGRGGTGEEDGGVSRQPYKRSGDVCILYNSRMPVSVFKKEDNTSSISFSFTLIETTQF
jgi:hypothetical protein